MLSTSGIRPAVQDLKLAKKQKKEKKENLKMRRGKNRKCVEERRRVSDERGENGLWGSIFVLWGERGTC